MRQVQKKERTDNPLTDHSDEAEDSVDIVKVPSKEDAPEGDKVLSTEAPEKDDAVDDGPLELSPRQQRRRERYDQIQRENAELQRRTMEAEHRAAAALAHAQLVQPQRQADPLDDEDKQIEADWKKHMDLADVLSQKATPEQQSEWRTEYLKLVRRQQMAVAKRVQRDATPQNTDDEHTRFYIRSNYPDVVSNPRALQYADGLLRQKLAREGRSAPAMADYDEACKQARRDFRMPGADKPPPSDATRRKFSGHGLNGASNGAAQGGRSEIRMNEDMMKMAEAKYTHVVDPKTGKKRALKPHEAHAKWAQNEGKRVLEKYQ